MFALQWLSALVVSHMFGALAASPLRFEGSYEGRSLVFDLPAQNRPSDFLASVEQFAQREGIDPGTTASLKKYVAGRAVALGLTPAASIQLDLSNKTHRLAPVVSYFMGQDLHAVARSAVKDYKLPLWAVMELVRSLERTLDDEGIGPDFRPWPSGYIGRPDPAVSLFKSFKRIRICFATHAIFDDNVRAFQHALTENQRRFELGLGAHNIPWEHVDDPDPFDTESLYILFPYPSTIPRYYILMQYEQLGQEAPDQSLFWRLIRSAVQIFDYSAVNRPHLDAIGIDSMHVPLSVSPATLVPSVPPVGQRRYDVIFFGKMTPRRAAFLTIVRQRVEAAGLTFKLCIHQDECFYDDKYNVVVALNVHSSDGPSILEAHRILALIANRVWVVSEPGEDAFYHTRLSGLVDFVASPEDMAARSIAAASQPRPALEAELDRRAGAVADGFGAHQVMQEAGVFEFLARRIGRGRHDGGAPN